MDICGPLKKPTVQGHSYYLLTTDDYTGWTSVTTFKNRQQFLPVIQQHYAALPCKLPRAIRMDSDGVFVSHAFKQWLGENNIRPEYCQPRRHQQNGAAGASIRSINDMARCMLVASGLPGKYWGYAVQHAVFVRNRVVSSNLDASPYFKAFSKQPDLNMLQEFLAPRSMLSMMMPESSSWVTKLPRVGFRVTLWILALHQLWCF